MKTLRLLLAFFLLLSCAASVGAVAPPSGGMMIFDPVARQGRFDLEFAGWSGATPGLFYRVEIDRIPHGANSALGHFGASFVFFTSLADGPHTVTGFIKDQLGNETQITKPLILDGTAPVITGPQGLAAVADSPAGVAVQYELTAADARDPGPLAVSVDPPSGSIFLPGVTYVTARAVDSLGNDAAYTFPVTVTRSYVVATPVAAAGKLDGALVGTPLDGDDGFQLYSLGTPTLTNLRRIAVTGTARNSGTGKTLAGVLLGKPQASGGTRWTMPLRVGAPAHEPGLLWKAFPREPFMDYSDDGFGGTITSPGLVPLEMGFYGRVSGPAVTLANDDVLGFCSLTEAGDEELLAVAREGGDAAGVPGGKFKSFLSATIAKRPPGFGGGTKRAIAFTAMLQIGPGGVEKTNDMGLWFWEDGALHLALREGQQIGGRTVRSFIALRGPVGHGHGMTADFESYHSGATAGQFTTTVLITFTDGTKRLAVAGSLGTQKLVDENTTESWVGAGETLPWGRFGSFSRHPYGMTVMLTSLVGVPITVNSAVLFETGDAESFRRVVKGDALPDGSVVTALSAPLGNTDYAMAFAGKTSAGVKGAWWGPAVQDALGMMEYFRIGGAAPSGGGGVWRNLSANALPDGMGPLFAAKLRAGSPALPAPGGVTAATDLGLWAVDSLGTTHLLIREGQELAGKSVRTFKALTAVSGSIAQTRSFTGKRDVVVWVLATDYTQHLIEFAVP